MRRIVSQSDLDREYRWQSAGTWSLVWMSPFLAALPITLVWWLFDRSSDIETIWRHFLFTSGVMIIVLAVNVFSVSWKMALGSALAQIATVALLYVLSPYLLKLLMAARALFA
jgi:hypothetical protein